MWSQISGSWFKGVTTEVGPVLVGCSRPSLGDLLSSSYRQHQETLTAERERRRHDREERLQRIAWEERNRLK